MLSYAGSATVVAPCMGYCPEITFHLALISTRQAVDFFADLHKDLGIKISDEQWQRMKDLEAILEVSLDLEPQNITCLRNHI
jgi:hypothetical protein